jgi:hypothetical protein
MSGVAWVLVCLFAGEGAAGAPVCPAPPTYVDQWLVVVGASRTEADARAIAAKGGYCVVPKDTLSGFKPDFLVVVAGASPTRKKALADLKAIRRDHKDAYVKQAGKSCVAEKDAAPGAPITPALRASFQATDSKIENREPAIVTSNSKTHYWNFSAEMTDGVPVWAEAFFHQGHEMRQEFFAFEKGKLVWAHAAEWWDTSTPRDMAPDEPQRGRRYYFVGNECYLQIEDQAIEGPICPQACPAGLGDKIAARGAQVAKAAVTHGPALDEIAEPLEVWVGHLGLLGTKLFE